MKELPVMVSSDREALSDAANPLALEGIEYVEYRTAQPQALGHVLELMGFRPVARHRSREVLLYRQGAMNVVVNAHGALAEEPPVLAAIALRVRDAAAAHRQVLDLGGWDVPVTVAPMELHIPAIHGVGASRIYFVDRWREFAIYDVDFVGIPGVERQPPALEGLHWFGVVQYIGLDRTDDWVEFYRRLFGFTVMGDERETGVLPQGTVLRSPCGQWHLQLVEPEPDAEDGVEQLRRLAFGAPDVPKAAAALRARGVSFVESNRLHVEWRGAVTQSWLGGVMFELIHHES
jgi:4-hydroxyphenylpyruvate dioxygenase